MRAEDTNIDEAVDYEADENPTTAAEEVVEEMTAAGVEPTADDVAVEAAQKQENGTEENAAKEAATSGDPSAESASKAEKSLDPNDPMNLPPQGTEVFIGGVPKTATEAQIKVFCEKVGEVHSVKLAKDPSNSDQNRGFGFARYFAKECAEAAKEKLHETELQDFGVKVRVSSTQAKHKLYLGNLPRAFTKEQVSDELNKTVKGLESFDLVMSKDIPNQNRGYAFLIFYNNECAAAAKELLSKPSFSLGGRQLTVSYAEPKTATEPAGNVQAKASKAIYVGGLPSGATEEGLKELFGKFGEVAKAVIPQATEKRPERQFGFVHFTEQSSADKAVTEATSGTKPELLGSSLEVKAARPQEQRQGSMNSMDYGYGGRGAPGRGGGRVSGSGRGQAFTPRGRGRGGRVPYSRTPAPYAQEYDQGYDQGYGVYDQSGAGYDQGYADPVQAYGGVAPMAAAGVSAGMTMVPMMLPTGQVGYVLQSVDGGGAADYGNYGAAGPDRAHASAHMGGGRGRGNSFRYRPY